MNPQSTMSVRPPLSRPAAHIAIGLGLLVATANLATAEDRIVLLDGSQMTGKITAIDAQGEISGDGFDKSVPLQGIRYVQRTADGVSEHPATTVEIHLVGGGHVRASGVTIREEKCIVQWPFGPEGLSLPIDAVRAIRLRPGEADDWFEKALAAPGEEFDQLLVKVDDKWQPIHGLVERLDSERVVFQFKEGERSIPRSKLLGIVVAFAGRPPDLSGQCRVLLQGGSSMWGQVRSLEADKLTLQVVGNASVSLPWAAVTRLDVRSDRLAFLSDLEPVQVIQKPIVTLLRPWQRDKSVAGGKLTLKGRTFEKGLGTHSRCLLSFEPDEPYGLLAAVIGIDDATDGRGDCDFVVLGDAKEIFRQRVRGKDNPREIKVDIRGVKRLTLAVEPGEDLDLADHADWCDARIIRTAE